MLARLVCPAIQARRWNSSLGSVNVAPELGLSQVFQAPTHQKLSERGGARVNYTEKPAFRSLLRKLEGATTAKKMEPEYAGTGQAPTSPQVAMKPVYLSCQTSAENVTIARRMLPEDANPAGNVHGGTILNMIEQAGFVVATRFCNQAAPGVKDKPPVCVALAQMEQTNFIAPVHIGDLAKLHAVATFTSERSVEVQVDVWTENVFTGESRQVNRATLWFAAVNSDTVPVDFVINQLTPSGSDEEKRFALGLKHYRQRKALLKYPVSPVTVHSSMNGFNMATESSVTLVQVMLPGDCHFNKNVGGGIIMKLMDSAAGLCAIKHSRSNVVTVSIETLNFMAPVLLSDITHVRASIIYTSAKAIDVYVDVEAERPQTGERVRTTNGIFTFVSFDENHRPQPVPQFAPKCLQQAVVFERRHRVHAERKCKHQSENVAFPISPSSGSAVSHSVS